MANHRPIRRTGRVAPVKTAAARTAAPRTAEDVRPAAGVEAASDAIRTTESRSAPVREADDIGDMPLRRRSRAERQESRFGVPSHLRQSGWDYQWWTTHILGQAVSRSEMTDVYQGGWRPVLASEMRDLVPPGDTGEFIEDGGQRLFKRPMAFTTEAKQEERELALQGTTEAIKARAQGTSQDGALGDIKGVRAVPLGMDMQAEAGVYNTPGR